MTKHTVEMKEKTAELGANPAHEALQLAYQAHTLAQVIYAHLAAQAWAVPAVPVTGFEPVTGYRAAPVMPMWGAPWTHHLGLGPVGIPPAWPPQMTEFWRM